MSTSRSSQLLLLFRSAHVTLLLCVTGCSTEAQSLLDSGVPAGTSTVSSRPTSQSDSSSGAATSGVGSAPAHSSKALSPSAASDARAAAFDGSASPETQDAGGGFPSAPDAASDASRGPEPDGSFAPADGQAPTLQPGNYGLGAEIDGQYFEFTTDLLTYNGRPPTMDIFAGTLDGRWASLRVFVAPDGERIEEGDFTCRDGRSYIMLIAEDGVYTSVDAPGGCFIHVDAAGTESGELFAGTFSATLVFSDGSHPVTLESGWFAGIVD